MPNCPFCNAPWATNVALGSHRRQCQSNPDRKTSKPMLGKSPWHKGLDKRDPRVEAAAIKRSATMTGKPSPTVWTENMRKAKSEWRKKLHQDYPETHPNRRLAGNRNKWTYPEKVAGNWLDLKGIKYEYNKKVGRFYPDFVIGNLIIEIDGERWHNPEKDALRDKELKDLGFTVFRIKASERIENRLEAIFTGSGLIR